MNISYMTKIKENLNKVINKYFKHLTPINSKMKKSLSGVSRLVMLDRYSQKDLTLDTLAKDDIVLVVIKKDPMFPTLGIGIVLEVKKNKVVVNIDEDYWAQIDTKYKHNKGTIEVHKSLVSKPLELYFEQIASRVSNHIGNDDEFIKNMYKELKDFNFVPAGRILYGAGSNTSTTFFNCFVMDYMEDSRSGISNHRKEVMEIMSRGGGVGTNGSTLRPKGCVALSVNGKSSGAVSWLNDLANLTNLVEQGGSRRGAQMIMLGIWHPDVIEFIISKMQNPEILQYISKNFDSKLIKMLAKDKLLFKKLTQLERETYNLATKTYSTSPAQAEAIKNAHSMLKANGRYTVKDIEFLSGANISIGISNKFMDAVKDDSVFELKFPDIANMTKGQKLDYDKNWRKVGDVEEWIKQDPKRPIKVYHKIRAKELWALINFCATYSAEPGIFFIDIANEFTNAKSYNQKVVCTNPCGEQPLAPYSVCNLGAINLSNFVDPYDKDVLWGKLKKTIEYAVEFQDIVIDKTPYFLEKNEIQAKGERRIGLGVMGYHDMLIWLGIKYGSPQALKFTDKLFEFIATTAYNKSSDISILKGSFPFLKDHKDFLKTGYVKKLPKSVKTTITKNKGIRNSHLLTIAPTGSTGTLVGVSTGLEPYFAFNYYRSGRLGKFMKVEQNIVNEWKQVNNHRDEKLPEFFVSAMELTPKEHVKTQLVIQRWIDSSISKTVNAPKGYTVKQVSKVYQSLFDGKAKGGTVYVDGSRNAQVLTLDKEDHTFDVIKDKLEEVKQEHANIPQNKSNRNIGSQVGDICPVCKEGVVEKLGGCNSCTICNAQLKCGI